MMHDRPTVSLGALLSVVVEGCVDLLFRGVGCKPYRGKVVRGLKGT